MTVSIYFDFFLIFALFAFSVGFGVAPSTTSYTRMSPCVLASFRRLTSEKEENKKPLSKAASI